MKNEQEVFEEGLDRLYNKLKQDPLFELRVEYGKFLLRHIDSLSITERKRYDELTEILCNNPSQ